MKFIALVAASVAIAVTGASAEPLADRKENMKERGALLRVLAPVAQGRADFDAATVLDALERLNANADAATDLDALWPSGSETGDTDSSPRIWEDREGYQQASDAYAAATAAAVEAAPQDLNAFRAVFAPVAAGCGTCHEGYRL